MTAQLGRSCSECAALRARLTVAEDALREIADGGCLVVHEHSGSWIDVGAPGRIAGGTLNTLKAMELVA